jgi:hypothetical protein
MEIISERQFSDVESASPNAGREPPMPSVTNKTKRPLIIPLPHGKKLHLGPGKSGEIASNAVDHAALKKLVEAGELEITRESSGTIDATGRAKQRTSAGGHTSRVIRRSGDR